MASFLNVLPDFKGKRRLARVLYRSLIESGAEVQTRGKYGCNYTLPNLKENLALDIFINGLYEKETHKILQSRIPTNGVFLDLGANIGSICVPLCKSRKDIQCIAVEAMPWIYEYLSKNISANDLNAEITPLNFALFDKDNESLPFYTSRDNYGKGSLSPVFSDKPEIVLTRKVDSIVADAKLSSVDMVKIDIEGYEYFAFKGGASLFSRNDAPDILFEFVDWAEAKANIPVGSAQELLLSFGYKIYFINGIDEYRPLQNVMNAGSAMFLATKRYK